MNNLLRYFVFLSLFFIPLGCQKKAAAPKHIFFIVIDTLRADHLGCYGYTVPTSPTIDHLAKKGVLFKNAFSTASNTLESVFSFFSSTTNLNNVVANESYDGFCSTLQTLFKKEGFNTLAVVSNPWLKARRDIFQDGFIHFQFVKSNKWLPNTTDNVSDAVLQFLETKFNSTGRNFFYIHYLDPHDDYRSPIDYGFFSGKPPTRSLKIDSLSGHLAVRKKKDPNFKGLPIPKPVTDNELNYIISSYDSEIRHVDFSLKKLLARLQEMNILQDSLVIIASDHGEEFLEHGCFKHGYQLYDETIHIPLIFYWQGHLAPGIKRILVSGIDIAPTILNLCQIKPPANMLGENILDKEVREESILFCTHFFNQEQKGMRTIRWKLIDNELTGDIKIFDIKNDPREQNNLFYNNQKKWDHLLKTYEKLLSKHVLQEDDKVRKPLEMDPETREQLKALGYF